MDPTPSGSPTLPGANTSTSGSTATGSAPASPRGITRTTISLGILTSNGYNGLASSAGLKGSSLGDQVAIAKSIVAYINSHGGIAGRKVVPVYYDINVGRYTSQESAEAATACAKFTQDSHVYAVAALVAWGNRDFYKCLAKHGVVAAAVEFSTRSMLRALPETLYVPSDLNYTRGLADAVDALTSAGWFGAKPKVGAVGVDTPDSRDSIENGLLPALRKHGISPATAPVYLRPGMDGSSGYSNGVLRMRTAHVDHVMFGQGASLLLFAEQAQSQGYYPRYMVDSRSSPGGTLQNTLPARTLQGAMGLGWMPTLDNSEWSSIKTPGRSRCTKASKASGQDLTQAGTAVVAYWACDQIFFIQDAVSRATTLTNPGFRAAAESLGSSFAPAATFTSAFAVGRLHDGASSYRLNAFIDSCSCFKYVTGPRPLPQ
ncbi:MAG: ABC transporter substrate-binding protein [Mycobacteriales bacterium]